MLDRTALRPNRLGLFGMSAEVAVDRIYAAAPPAIARDCAALYQRLGIQAAKDKRSSLEHGQACIVSLRALAGALRCSVRSVQRWLDWLVKAGVVEVFARADRTGSLPSEFVFRYPRATGGTIGQGVTRNVPQQAPGDSPDAISVAGDTPVPERPGDAPVTPFPSGEEDKTSIDSVKAAARQLLAEARTRAKERRDATTMAPEQGEPPAMPCVQGAPAVQLTGEQPAAPPRVPPVPSGPRPASTPSRPSRPPAGAATPGASPRGPVPLSTLLVNRLHPCSPLLTNGVEGTQPLPLRGEQTPGSSRPTAPAAGGCTAGRSA